MSTSRKTRVMQERGLIIAAIAVIGIAGLGITLITIPSIQPFSIVPLFPDPSKEGQNIVEALPPVLIEGEYRNGWFDEPLFNLPAIYEAYGSYTRGNLHFVMYDDLPTLAYDPLAVIGYPQMVRISLHFSNAPEIIFETGFQGAYGTMLDTIIMRISIRHQQGTILEINMDQHDYVSLIGQGGTYNRDVTQITAPGELRDVNFEIIITRNEKTVNIIDNQRPENDRSINITDFIGDYQANRVTLSLAGIRDSYNVPAEYAYFVNPTLQTRNIIDE